MFKIYSLALLSFLTLQNSYAADQKEEFPGKETMKRRMEEQCKEVEYLQQKMGKIVTYCEKNFCQSSNLSLEKPSEEKSFNDKNLLVNNSQAILTEEIKRFTKHLDDMKTNISKELSKALNEGRIYHLKHQEALKKEATKYRQLGITSFLKGLDEENLPSQERSPGISLDAFPLTFDHPDKNNDRIYLRLSEEDWESLRESGVNSELIDNLFSHLQTDVSALYDMIQRGYRNRQEQNRQ